MGAWKRYDASESDHEVAREAVCAPCRRDADYLPGNFQLGPWKIIFEPHLNTNPATEADITAARPTGVLLPKIKAEIETLRQQTGAGATIDDLGR